MESLSIEVWSDIACPWCYVGKRRLETALSRFAHADAVRVTWRAFELNPAAPPLEPGPVCYAERLAKKYGTSPAHAQAMIERMVMIAANEGLAMDFERIRPGNSFDAHRMLQLAKRNGMQDRMKERLFRAYLCEGMAIGDHDTLLRLAGDVGLDTDDAQGLLTSDLYAREVPSLFRSSPPGRQYAVCHDHGRRRRHGARSVPC